MLSVYRVELLLASTLTIALLSDLDALQEVLVQRLIVAGRIGISIRLALTTRVVLILEALR